MANITELQLQGDSTVHKLNDARITTTAVTNPTHILTTNSDVTSIAPITSANLASVLGGQATIVNSTNDANTFVTSGHYRWDSSSYLPANCPSVNAAGEIEVIAFGYLVFQILRTNQGGVWQRAKWSTNAWTSWKAVSTDIPSFYNNYHDIASLASALGAHYGKEAMNSGDLNNLITNQCLVVDNRTNGLSNVPSNFTSMGILTVTSTSQNYGTEQKLYVTQSPNSNAIYYRYKWGNSWSSWVQK